MGNFFTQKGLTTGSMYPSLCLVSLSGLVSYWRGEKERTHASACLYKTAPSGAS